MVKEYKNYINGEWVDASDGARFDNINPATGELVATFPKSSREDTLRAIAAAKAAYPAWKAVPAPKRGEIIKRASDILVRDKEDIARTMTMEMGKVIAETRGDVQEGIDCGYYFSGEGRRWFGFTTPSELPNKFAMAIRQPIGVVGLITPWNFPLAIPTWKMFPALLCGNSVVFKPATDTPLSAARFVEVLAEAGVPKGVVNFVTGGGGTVGNTIVEHPDVRAISFTGSSEIGRQLGISCGKSLKRLSLELGGKNAQIVMDDADLELALRGALWGAFGTTGQRCTATSRLIVHTAVYDKFLKMIVDAASKLRLGNGLEPTTDVGPCVSKSQRESVHSYVEIGLNEDHAELVLGGQYATGGDLDKGFFYQPTIFAGVKPNMRIAQEEIFGPVLSVIRVNDFEEAVEVLNGTVYGLSSSIYTRDVNRAFKAIEQIEAGITYVNGPTIGAEVHLPFGGVKDTGNGHREAAMTVLDFMSEWKAVYVDYSGTLQRAQIDNN